MDNLSESSTCSLDDEDLANFADVPLAQNTRREPPSGFARPNFGFQLNMQAVVPDEPEAPRVPNGLQSMRSEPLYLPETSRPRQPPGLALAMAQARPGTSLTGIAEEAAASLLTRRGPLKPPMLSLSNPASASPVPSGAPTPAIHAAFGESPTCHRLSAWPPLTTSRRPTGPVRVDLVSTAFLVQAPRRNGLSRSDGGGAGGGDPPDVEAAEAANAVSIGERIVQQCRGQLGIDPRDLKFFELRPLDISAMPESCSHVGVMIQGSTFSLAAIEDMLARAKRDEHLTTLLDGALRDSSHYAVEAKRHAEQLAKQNEELAVLRERLQAAEAANQHLREQLQRSDEHRQLLGGTIRAITKEFDDFKSRLVVEGSVEQLLPLQQLNLGGGGGGRGEGGGGAPAHGQGPAAAPAPSLPGSFAVPPPPPAASAAGAAGSQPPVLGGGGLGSGSGGSMAGSAFLSGPGAGFGGGGGGATSRGDPPPLRR